MGLFGEEEFGELESYHLGRTKVRPLSYHMGKEINDNSEYNRNKPIGIRKFYFLAISRKSSGILHIFDSFRR